MLNLLFIDDEPDALAPLLRFFSRKKDNGEIDYRYDVCTFFEAEERISSIRPDIVVLDLLLDGREPEGRNTCEHIWQNHFCPIVVYSARPDLLDHDLRAHPFIESVTKGRNSPRKALGAVLKFNPHIAALRQAETDLRQCFSGAMRDLAPLVFRVSKPEARVDIIRRAGRRRLAAMLDKPAGQDEILASWEHYLFPPVADDLQLGDVLKLRRNSADDPKAFRVVLTPSCDLVASGGRNPKTTTLLAARCVPMKDALALAGLPDMSRAKIKRDLGRAMLSQGYRVPVIPFPALDGRVPSMAANLRDLELIPLANIGQRRKYISVVSIDSPFRELVAWAYLQTAGRPGLPDRDLAAWSDEIAANVHHDEGDAA